MYYIRGRRTPTANEEMIGKTKDFYLAKQMAISAIRAGWQSVHVFSHTFQEEV